MRILALSDIHAESGKFKKLAKLLKRTNPDMVVLAGDLTVPGLEHTTQELLDTLRGRKVVAVTGNWDTEKVEKILDKNGVNIHNKALKIGDIGVVGFSGPRSIDLGSLTLLNYDPIHYKLEEIENCEKKIVVTHFPPANTKADKIFAGAHVGSEFLRSLIEDKQPDLVICGHIHEARGVDKIGKTTIVNPGALCDGYAALIDFSGKEPKTEFLDV